MAKRKGKSKGERLHLVSSERRVIQHDIYVDDDLPIDEVHLDYFDRPGHKVFTIVFSARELFPMLFENKE